MDNFLYNHKAQARDKITTILFDLDGTILDTRESIFQSFVHSLTSLGHKAPSKKDVFSHVGKELNEVIAGITGSKGKVSEIRELIRSFQLANLHLVKLYAGADEVLRELRSRGYKLGAVTNARRAGSLARLEHVGILNLFDTVVAVDDVENPKPHPEPILLALKNLNELPENAIMIGDSHFDIGSGKKAGLKTIRVTYGFHTGEMENPKPDYFVDDIKELLKLL